MEGRSIRRAFVVVRNVPMRTAARISGEVQVVVWKRSIATTLLSLFSGLRSSDRAHLKREGMGAEVLHVRRYTPVARSTCRG